MYNKDLECQSVICSFRLFILFVCSFLCQEFRLLKIRVIVFFRLECEDYRLWTFSEA